MPAWTGMAGQRIDHARQYRWMRGGAVPQPQPRGQAAQPAGNSSSNGSGPVPGAGQSGGGHMPAQIQPAIDEIEQLGGWSPDHATDLDETIRSLSGISASVGTSFHQIARTLEGAGVHEDFSATLDTAANDIEHHSAELESHLAGGLMSHDGGSRRGGVTSPQVRGVTDTVHELGSWDPESPEDLDEVITSLSRVIQAVQVSYNQLGQTIAETGAHSSYQQHLHHAADGIGPVADEMENTFIGGVIKRPGS
jgi:hypothetical protein